VNNIIKSAKNYEEYSFRIAEPVKILMDIHVQNALSAAAGWKINQRNQLGNIKTSNGQSLIKGEDKALSEIDLLMRKIKISDFTPLEPLMGLSDELDKFIFRNVNNCVNNLTNAFSKNEYWTSNNVYDSENSSTQDNMYKTYIRQIKAAARFVSKNIDSYKGFVANSLSNSNGKRENSYQKALTHDLLFTATKSRGELDETFTSLPLNHTQKIIKALKEFMGDDIVGDFAKEIYGRLSYDSKDVGLGKLLSTLNDITPLDSITHSGYEKNAVSGEFETVERPLSEFIEIMIKIMRDGDNESELVDELNTLVEKINSRELHNIQKEAAKIRKDDPSDDYTYDLNGTL